MDQFYFEEGYLEASYFTVMREAASALPVTMTFSAQGDIADDTGYYIPDYIAVGYFETGIIEAQGAFSVTASSQIEITRVRTADSAASVSATQTVIVERITQAVAAVTVTVTKSCTVTRIRDSAAAFTAAFAPTLTATAFKNHTAVLDSVSTMSVNAQANRSTNVLLAHIADLNAMAAKTTDVNSSMAVIASQSTTATKTASPSISLSSSAAIVCTLGKVHLAQSQLSSLSSLTTSRYFGSSRPRNLSAEGDGFDFNNYFSGNQLDTSSLTGDQFIQFTSNLGSIVPKANQSWVFSFVYSSLGTTRSNGFLAVSFLTSSDNNTFANVRTLNSTGTSWRLDLFKTGQATVSQTFTAGSFQNKIAVAYENGYVGIFVDNTRVALINLSSVTAVNWQRYNELAKPRFSLARNVAFDEFHFATGTRLEYNPQSTTVSATGTQINQPVTTQALYHLNSNGLDDIAVTESAAAALASVFTQQTIGSGTFVPRSAQAALSSTVTFTAQGDRPASASAALASTSTLSVIIGSVKDSIALNAGAFTVTTQESRLRGAASSITSAFAPTLTATVTRRGDIALSSVFALTADANSFTDSGAAIAAVFAVSATANGIQRQGASALSSQFNQTTVIGKLQSVNVPITSAFSTVMNVIQIEGVVANLQSTFSVNASVTRLPGIILTLPSNFTTSITAFNAVHDTEQNRIYSYDVWHFDSAGEQQPYDGDELVGNFSGEESKFGTDAVRLPQQQSGQANGGYPGYHEGATAAQAYVPGYFSTLPDFTVDFFIKISYTSNEGFVIAVKEIFGPFLQLQINRQGSDNLGTYRLVKIDSNDTILATVQGAGNNGGHTNPFQAGVYAGLANNWEHIAVQYKNGMAQLYVGGIYKGQFSYSGPFHQYVNFAVPQANCAIDELRIDSQTAYYSGNFTPPTVAYADPTPRFYGFKRNGYAILEPRVTMQIIGFSIVTLTTPATFSTTAVSTITANQTARPTVNALVTSSLVTNAGKNVEIGSALASQSTISVTAVKVTRTSADLNVVGAQSTANDRLRTTTVALATTATISIDAVKRTGIVLSLNTAATQSVTGFRIKQGQASISALYSQLSVAFQNATGTVLLETVTAMQITAEKNAVGVIALASQFTQSTNSADSKTVRVSSAIAAEFTQSVEGLRIQPAGADVSAQFTQTTNTANSKTTRVTAALATTVTTTATAARTRSTPTTLSAATAIVCNNVVLRQASANLVDSFDVLCSVQYIIRITATFSAFNSQLTVGEIINIDPALQLMIEPETRIRKIQQETRVLSIESETRVNIIED